MREVEEQQELRCGEANPDQGLAGTSGQKPNADSQRQPYKGPAMPGVLKIPQHQMRHKRGG